MTRTGELETQLSMDSLLERAENAEWIFKARLVVAAFCRAAVEFTAEDVRERMLQDPPQANLMGAVFRQMADEGWITPRGYRKATRPDSHGRVLTVWGRP